MNYKVLQNNKFELITPVWHSSWFGWQQQQ